MRPHSNILIYIYKAIRAIQITWRTSFRIIMGARNNPEAHKLLALGRMDWAPDLFKLAKAELRVLGTENVVHEAPHIYVMNHQSFMDIPAAFLALPVNIAFVAKKEIEAMPLMGRAMREIGMIFVDRRNQRIAIESMKAGAEMVRSGVNVFAFPEGTRSKDGRIQSFKKGSFLLAIEAGVPMVPMAVQGANDVLPPAGFKPEAGLITVAIGEPISTHGYTGETVPLLMDRVRLQIISLSESIGGRGGD